MTAPTGSGEPAGPPIGPWRNAVMLGFALGGVTISTWGPRLPQLRADLRVGDAAIGLMLAGVTVGSILGLTASTAVLSRFGSRRAIRGLLGLVSVGVATIGLGAGVGHSVTAAAAGFGLVGLGIGAVDVTLNVEGAAVERAAGRTLMPLMHAAWSAGVIVGAGIGAGSAAARLPVAVQFPGEAVLIAAAAALAVRRLPDSPPVEHGTRKPPLAARLRTWLRGWYDPRLLLIGLVMLGVELGEGTANSWLTLAAGQGHHRPNGVAALFLVVFAATETTTRVLSGPLVDRVGRVHTLRITIALGVVGIALFVAATAAWLLVLGTVLWAVGVSMGFPLGMSAAADSGPDPAARVSVVASVGYLANLAGPPFIGLLAEQIGLLDALWLVAVLFVIGFAAAGALRPSASARPVATGS